MMVQAGQSLVTIVHGEGQAPKGSCPRDLTSYQWSENKSYDVTACEDLGCRLAQPLPSGNQSRIRVTKGLGWVSRAEPSSDAGLGPLRKSWL